MTKKYDWLLFSVVLLLTVIGLVVLHAISFRDPSLAPDFNPTIQIVAALIGFAGLIFAARMDYRLLARVAPIWYLTGLLLLVVVLIAGDASGGATRSIDLGIAEFQPAEIAKLGLIVMLAKYYSSNRSSLGRLRYFIGSLVLLAAVSVLIILQPDLGSTAVVLLVWFAQTLMSSTRRSFILILVLISLAALPLVAQVLEPYQQARLDTFFDPAADPQGQGYNVNQAMIAVGSGQVFGRGLGGGTQSNLNFLPSQHTDFVFAVLAEKLGLVGAGTVMVLFVLLFWRSVKITWEAKDMFATLLGTGISTMILVQVLVTIGMSLGLVPVTGLPLPFIAYGGTSLIVNLFSIGILQSIASHNQELQFRQ